MNLRWISLITITAILFVCLDFGKPHYRGLPITIEYKKGTVRSGVDREGNPWSQKMFYHYGYFDNITGADGKALDFYLNPDSRSDKLFRIIQLDILTKKFDEYKIMIGFDNVEDAKQGYLIHYPDDWAGYGGIEEITLEEIK